MVVIDMHAHVKSPKETIEIGARRVGMAVQYRYSDPPGPEHIIERMDAADPRVDKAVIFGPSNKAGNDYVKQCVDKYPDRIIGFGNVDARLGEEAITEIHRFVEELGLSGMGKVQAQRFPIYSKCFQNVMEHITRLRIPILITTDRTNYQNSLAVGALIESFPEAKVVIGHFGEQTSSEAILIAKKMDNVWLETSGVYYNKNLMKAIKIVGYERILFGADYPSLMPAPQLELDRIAMLDIPPEQKAAILGGNAARLLGIK